METQKNFIGLKQIVIIVLLSVLTIVVSMVTGIPFMTSPKWSVLGGYSLAALINGMIYVLIITKSPMRGTNLLFFGVKALYVLVMGQIPTVIVYLIGAIICEGITWNDGYKKPLIAGISYTVHNVIFSIGTFTPIFLNPTSYGEQMTAQMAEYGMDAESIEVMVNAMIYDLVAPGFVLLASAMIAIASVIGMFIGVKMMKKHFKPAGVA